jgi:hypothetical protein
VIVVAAAGGAINTRAEPVTIVANATPATNLLIADMIGPFEECLKPLKNIRNLGDPVSTV